MALMLLCMHNLQQNGSVLQSDASVQVTRWAKQAHGVTLRLQLIHSSCAAEQEPVLPAEGMPFWVYSRVARHLQTASSSSASVTVLTYAANWPAQ